MFKSLLPWFMLVALHAAEPDMKAMKEALAANAEAFETIELKGDGTAVKFEINLGAKSAEFDGNSYDGFRFRCPDGIEAKDFVWYFNAPTSWGNWYIIPVKGEAKQAFRDWLDADKLYLPFDKSSEKERTRILQTLDGSYFKAGEEYIMWFRKVGDKGSAALRGIAAFAKKNDSWDSPDVEKALSLKTAPVEEQVAALNSRGGLILLDNRFFERGYAEERIDSAFASIRSTKQMSNGLFVTMQTFVPPCKTSPSLAEIIKQHGAPDFIRSTDEQDQVRKHMNDKAMDDDEQNITRNYYDHFSFEVESDAKDPKVLRVGTYGCDFADLRPSNSGATYSGIGIENLTVFHRDGKEVGRAYYFLDGSYKPLFITVPPPGEYRSDKQVLISEGDGKWKWENRFPDGNVARRILLKDNLFNGDAEGFHENSKTAFKATYKDGELEGDAIQFDEDGKEISRRSFKNGKAVKE